MNSSANSPYISKIHNLRPFIVFYLYASFVLSFVIWQWNRFQLWEIGSQFVQLAYPGSLAMKQMTWKGLKKADQ